MRARLALVVSVLFFAVALVGVASPSQARMEKDCGDFDTQAQAQHYFESHGGGPHHDVDGLDADGDGVACETLPCPCDNYNGGGGNPGGAKPPHKLVAKGREIGNTDHFIVYGSVVTFKGHRIRVEKKVGSGHFKAYKLTRTNARTGKYKAGIKQAGTKKTCFQVVVPATKKYRLTAKVIGCITTSK